MQIAIILFRTSRKLKVHPNNYVQCYTNLVNCLSFHNKSITFSVLSDVFDNNFSVYVEHVVLHNKQIKQPSYCGPCVLMIVFMITRSRKSSATTKFEHTRLMNEYFSGKVTKGGVRGARLGVRGSW
jgi:hypothetical protein